MTPAGHLRHAKALLEDPKHWTKGAFGRSPDGCPMGMGAPDAVSWCAMGAMHAIRDADKQVRMQAMLYLHNALPQPMTPRQDITRYNDSAFTTHKDLMAWFDRAIALAET